MAKLKLKLEPGVETPKYAHEGDSGMDVRAIKVKAIYKNQNSLESINPEAMAKIQKNFLNPEVGYVYLRAGERCLFGTGIYPEIPEGFEIQTRSKSGQALKKGITMSNGIGTIDLPYKGEIGIIVTNTTSDLVKIYYKEKIAQIVLTPVEKADIEIIENLSSSTRNEGSYGSTGII